MNKKSKKRAKKLLKLNISKSYKFKGKRILAKPIPIKNNQLIPIENKLIFIENKLSPILKKIRSKLDIILLFFALTLIISLIYLLYWHLNNKNNEKIIDMVSEDIEIVQDGDTSAPVIDFESLKSKNSSCFAWLIVDGTKINYPVVQYTDNDYYISHSFDNSHNPAGWIFADYRNECNGNDKNLVIYGHNRRDGSMFSSLRNILKDDWYSNENNLTIKLYTPEGLTEYKVFSVYEVRAESYYATKIFASDSTYQNFLNTLKSRSIHDFNVPLSTNDSILTLSTCSNNSAYRTVLHAKKIQ